MPGRVVHTKRIRGSGQIRQARLACTSPCEDRPVHTARQSLPCSRPSPPLASAVRDARADRRTPKPSPSRRCSQGGRRSCRTPPRIVLHGGLDGGMEAGVRVGHLPYEPPRQKVEVSVLLFDSRSKFGHVEAILPVLRPAAQTKPGGKASGSPNHDLSPARHLVGNSAASLFPRLPQAVAHAGGIVTDHQPRDLVCPLHYITLCHCPHLRRVLSLSL